MYKIGDHIEIKRVADEKLEIKINNEKAIVGTETLAAVLMEEMPKDRAKNLFAVIEDREMRQGKARVVVKAHKDIKRGEDVCFTLDINRYVNTGGIRVTDSGIIY